MLAIFVVSNGADNGYLSLRERIDEANTNPGPDTVIIAEVFDFTLDGDCDSQRYLAHFSRGRRRRGDGTSRNHDWL